MKRIISILAVLALVSMAAQAAEVKSQNIAGVVEVSVGAGQLALVGVNMDGFGGDPTLESLFGDVAVADGNYVVADRFFVFNTATSQYDKFAKYDGDGKWYRCNSSEEWNDGTVQTNLSIPVGTGLFIRCNPNQAQTFTMTGEAVLNAQATINLVLGLQMVSFPFSSSKVLDDTDLAGSSGSTAAENYAVADQVIFLENGEYQRYALYTDGKWYGCNSSDEWNDGTKPGSEKTISLGEGFWYRARNAGGVTWNETNPYLANL